MKLEMKIVLRIKHIMDHTLKQFMVLSLIRKDNIIYKDIANDYGPI